MTSNFTAWIVRLAAVTAALALVAPMFADDKAKGKDDHGHKDAGHGAHKAPMYKGEIHDHKTGLHETRAFDFSKPEEKAKFNELLEHGELHHVELMTTPDLFNIGSLKFDLGVYTLILFGLLLFILGKYAWPNMLEGLKKREDNIRSALDEAKQARLEAQNLSNELMGERNKAAEKVRLMLEEARKDAESTKADMITAARNEIQTERDRLKREIETETDQSLQKIWSLAANLATQASAQALKKQLDGDAHKRLIDEALSDLKKAGTN